MACNFDITAHMLRVATCVPTLRPADVMGNVTNILDLCDRANTAQCDVAVFPELSITGYTCADLFHSDTLLEQAYIGLDRIIEYSCLNAGLMIVVGLPVRHAGRLYNCAAVIYNGKLHGLVPKIHLPNYNEFYERRWFSSGADADAMVHVGNLNLNVRICANQIFRLRNANIGIEICEDLWVPDSPSTKLAMSGATLILNLSASDELIGKHAYLLDLVRNQSARCRCAYAYASAGFGESSTDMAFTGNGIIAENGRILAASRRFLTDNQITIADIDIDILNHDRIHFGTFAEAVSLPDQNMICDVDRYPMAEVPVHHKTQPLAYRDIDPHPFVDSDPAKLKGRCDEISSIQAWGLATRLSAIGCKTAVIGISGGLDSTLALLVTVKAFDLLKLNRKGIKAITMPGFGTSSRTLDNARLLMEELGVEMMEIPIGADVMSHLHNIGHDGKKCDITYENAQARERTQILMDVANKFNGIVIGTGDLSELALGWCTYNGDQMSMYGVNASIPKTLVRYLVQGYADDTDNQTLRNVLIDIVATPISPELLPAAGNGEIAQLTEDTVGPYELHDFFLYHFLRYGSEPIKIACLAEKAFDGKYDHHTISKWLKTFIKRFFSQQFKRSCMPDGVKVGSICLSPRGDWRMPSDACVNIWLNQLDS